MSSLPQKQLNCKELYKFLRKSTEVLLLLSCRGVKIISKEI